MRVLEVSPRWTRQRLAVLEAVDCDLKRAFSVLYCLAGACAITYMMGWVRFNFLAVPAGPLSTYAVATLGLAAAAGALYALLLPAIAVALGVERMVQRRIRAMDVFARGAAGEPTRAQKYLPGREEPAEGRYSMQPECLP